MEVKKNKKYDVRDKRQDFFLFGLAFTLLMVFGAFSITSSDGNKKEITRVVIAEEIVVMENTVQKKPPPPEPPPELEIVEDDEEIPEEQEEIDDSETDQDEEMEDYEDVDVLEDTDEIFEIFDVSKMAEFMDGGEDGLQKFLGENITYPDMAVENEIMGLVMVEFVVNKKGKVEKVRVISAKKGFGLEEEAIRVVKLTSGKWTPAEQRKNPVNMRYRVPIKFQF